MMKTNTEHETAAALSMQHAAGEIAAILLERMHSLGATRESVMDVSGTLAIIVATACIQSATVGD